MWVLSVFYGDFIRGEKSGEEGGEKSGEDNREDNREAFSTYFYL